jgi:DUF4097 and DUF4098 domain-containing protein YvlB
MKWQILTVLALTAMNVTAQTHTEKITKELVFEKRSPENTLMVANVNGNIHVVGYEGDKVIIEVNKWISGKTEARLEKGKKDLQLGVMDRADTLILYTQDGCMSFGHHAQRKNKNGWHRSGWGYDWECNGRNCESEFDYKMDFTIRVPVGVNLVLSTINEGDVTVENVSGAVKANNINGSIRLTNLSREADATTINGNVDVTYTSNPKNECRFYSLNGDINALFQKGLAANLSFESFNGDFYTNVDKIESLPVTVEKTGNGESVKYKISDTRYRIGNGGVFLDFETFNGNVYLKEQD